MSGFVGIFHRDGRPVDAGQLEKLTESLRFRGPDGTHTWRRGPVGLGYAQFVTHPARDGEIQPLSLDERFWIAGHTRLDARDELIRALGHSGRSEASRHAGDAELVLHAYRTWGAECLAHIHGDFSFAIWDQAERRLFAARDRLGVRPFFYAQFADLVLVGNTLSTLRAHPRISERLYEPALADYLVVGNLLEPDKTYFADIRRLPPAHTLIVTTGAVRVARYWSLPIEPELHYRRAEEYVEHFAQVMSQAVADRCPPGPVSLFMSGGLDSGTLAAALVGKLRPAPAGVRPKGFCVGWNKVFADPEPQLARQSAQAMGLPLEVWEIPDCEPFKGWGADEGAGPEPEDDFYRANTIESLRRAGEHSRVALSGRGGDEIYAPEFLIDELRRAPRWSLVRGALELWARTRRRPPLGLRRLLEPAADPPSWARVPAWINAEWIAPLCMAERLQGLAPPRAPRVPRANARYRLGSHRWSAGFEFSDAGYTGARTDLRYPFMDERVVAFALRLPPFPWLVGKHLQRRALGGCLPASITQRQKALLAGEPYAVWTARATWSPPPAPELEGRIHAAAWTEAWLRPVASGERGIAEWRLARCNALAYWRKAHAASGASLRAVA